MAQEIWAYECSGIFRAIWSLRWLYLALQYIWRWNIFNIFLKNIVCLTSKTDKNVKSHPSTIGCEITIFERTFSFICCIHFDINWVDFGELFEQNCFTFHDWFRGQCTDVSKTEDCSSVWYNCNQVTLNHSSIIRLMLNTLISREFLLEPTFVSVIVS